MLLRVIARLNVGGPALHVTYLSRGLATRGYDTTLVAGEIAAGEESMAFVAERAGVEVVPVPGLSREVSPVRDLAGRDPARPADPARAPADRAHAHGEGGRRRTNGRAARRAAAPDRRAHLPRPRPAWVLRRGRLTRLPPDRDCARARTDVLVAVSPQVRDELVRLGVAPAEKFAVIRLGIELEPRRALRGGRRSVRRRIGIGDERFVVGWFGRMTAVKRTEDMLGAVAALRERGVDALLLLVGDGADRAGWKTRPSRWALARHCLFLGYQEDVAPWYAACDVVALTSANEGRR